MTINLSGRIVDLTLLLENNMPVHGLFPRPVILPHHRHEDTIEMGLGVPDDAFTAATTQLSTIDHVGTHLDAPFHFDPEGDTVDKLPLETFMGKAVCLDLRHIPELGDVDVPDLVAAEEQAGVRIDGHIVLLCSGLTRRRYPRPEAVSRNWGLTAAATHWLADRGSRVHGVEGPSTDRPDWTEFPSHRACRDRGITHYEWLVDLERLIGEGEFFFSGLPLKIGGGSGSPVRAFAVLD